jgi:hypothetical protein
MYIYTFKDEGVGCSKMMPMVSYSHELWWNYSLSICAEWGRSNANICALYYWKLLQWVFAVFSPCAKHACGRIRKGKLNSFDYFFYYPSQRQLHAVSNKYSSSMMLTDQYVRVAFVPKPHRYCQSTEVISRRLNKKEFVSFVNFSSKVGNNYKNASSTNMNSSSRVSPFTLSTRSFGLESLSRSRLPKIHDKNQANQSLFSPLTVDSDQEKSETK